MKPIHVFDSLLSKEALSGVQDFFSGSIRWRYGWPQGTKDPFSHWSHDFLGAALANQENLEEKLCGNAEFGPVARIWRDLKEGPFHGHHLVRCYANAHTFGVEGHPHYDVVDKSQVDNFTAVVYINPVWKVEWAGELALIDETGDVFFSILPKPGRVAIIPGEVLHAARGVSRSCPAIRVSLAFKTRLPY